MPFKEHMDERLASKVVIFQSETQNFLFLFDPIRHASNTSRATAVKAFQIKKSWILLRNPSFAILDPFLVGKKIHITETNFSYR